MAGTKDDLEQVIELLMEQLRPQLLALDDDTLAIAASKGLVRRAHKELEKSSDPILEPWGDRLNLTWQDHTVTFPLNQLLEATCTCPAADVCRHILLSCLWLRSRLPTQSPLDFSEATSTPTRPAEAPRLPAYSLADLTAWATTATLREGFAFLQQELHQIDTANPITVRFPQANITCRYATATGLAGMLCSCKARQVCLHQVAAVAAILRSQGTELSLPESSPVDKPDAATAVAAAQVITAAQSLLEQTVAIGLLHLSDISHQQFVTLAVSAQGVKLPRLSLALRGIASEIELHLKRDAAADSDRLFERMAQTYALRAALQQAAPAYPVHLAGQAQSRYTEVGTLELVGLGAYPWRTASGFAGLTVLFWDMSANQWCSWSESRPLFHRQHYNPNRAYRQAGPWEGITSPAEASQSRLRLFNTRRNYQQRLSTSSETLGTPLGPTRTTDWQAIPLCFQDWQILRRHMASTLPLGLAEPNPLHRLAILQPHRWGSRQFDPVQQRLTWVVFDAQEQPLVLRMRFASTDAIALEHLEQLDPDTLSGYGIVGSVDLDQDMMYCQPIALCCPADAGESVTGESVTGESAIFNLHFPPKEEKKKEKSGEAIAPQTDPKINPKTALELEPQISPESLPALSDDSPETAPTPSSGGTDAPLEFLLIALQRLAERGQHGFDQATHQDLSQKANYFDQVGMATLAGALRRFAESPKTQSSQLLKIRYLCALYSSVPVD